MPSAGSDLIIHWSYCAQICSEGQHATLQLLVLTQSSSPKWTEGFTCRCAYTISASYNGWWYQIFCEAAPELGSHRGPLDKKVPALTTLLYCFSCHVFNAYAFLDMFLWPKNLATKFFPLKFNCLAICLATSGLSNIDFVVLQFWAFSSSIGAAWAEWIVYKIWDWGDELTGKQGGRHGADMVSEVVLGLVWVV